MAPEEFPDLGQEEELALGQTAEDYIVLLTSATEGMTVAEMREVTGHSNSTAYKALDQLSAHNLIVKEVNSQKRTGGRKPQSVRLNSEQVPQLIEYFEAQYDRALRIIDALRYCLPPDHEG